VGTQRAILATEVTENLFKGYKEVYENAISEIKIVSKQITKLKKDHKEVKKNYKKIVKKDRKKAAFYAKKGEKISKKYYVLKKEKGNAEDMVNREFPFSFFST
jgi:predicted phage-related endonuclease